MRDPNTPLELDGVSTYSISDRKSKVGVNDFTRPFKSGGSFSDFLETLPDILAGRDIVNVINAVADAHTQGKKVFFAMGGHVIKTGMNPVVVDLLERSVFSMIAVNGSCIIHDLEVALAGKTSEDVDASLDSGDFGMAEETSQFLNRAVLRAGKDKKGLGRAVGELINEEKLPYREYSIMAAGARLGVPVTVHVAMGTDIIHMHPGFDPAACGEASHTDFRIFASNIAELNRGVYINAGSAVILPEVFLKAITLVRNLGYTPEEFTTVTLDFIRQYRPMTNVVNRPVQKKGKGYSIVGHHEILIPLIAAGVIEKIGNA